MMENKKVEASLSMVVSKTFSGLNMNALRYLLPMWVSPLSGVTLRYMFAAIVFQIIGVFIEPETSTRKEKIYLFLLGTLGVYGFMFLYLVGLSRTTSVSSSIFTSLQPIWVFVVVVVFFKERINVLKVAGVFLGPGGAILCILAQKNDDLASDVLTRNVLCLLSSIVYAIYLVASNRILKSVGMFTVLKYTFAEAAFPSTLISAITGFHTPVFSGPVHWFPLSVLLFALIFPTVVSYLLMPIGLRYLKTTVVVIYGYLILVVATIVSLLAGQDRFSWAQTIAIGMIYISIYLVEMTEAKGEPPGNSDKPDSLPPHGS